MNSLRRILARRLVTTLLTAIFLLAIPFSASASSGAALPAVCTAVGGSIGTNTTWTYAASPYCVTSSVDVLSGVTLTIQPGVTLLISSGQGIQVDGTLVARGTASAPINFTSANLTKAPGDWNQILFTASSVPATFDTNGNYLSGSALQYAVIQYASGIAATGGNTGAIWSLSSPYLDHLTVQKNLLDGINLNGPNAAVTNSRFLANGGFGISGWVSGPILVKDNLISESSDDLSADVGIAVSGSAMNITGNVITRASPVDATNLIDVEGSSALSVTNNVLSGGGMTINTPASGATISGNVINGPGVYGISLENMQGGAYLISGNAISQGFATGIYSPGATLTRFPSSGTSSRPIQRDCLC